MTESGQAGGTSKKWTDGSHDKRPGRVVSSSNCQSEDGRRFGGLGWKTWKSGARWQGWCTAIHCRRHRRMCLRSNGLSGHYGNSHHDAHLPAHSAACLQPALVTVALSQPVEKWAAHVLLNRRLPAGTAPLEFEVKLTGTYLFWSNMHA